MTGVTHLLLLCGLAIATFFAPLRARELVIQGKSPATARPKADFQPQVSDRNILGLDHAGKYGLPLQALSSDNPVIIRILAIKVDFRKEVPDDPQTTGDGNFDLRSQSQFIADEGYSIDPSPHNSSYFRAHLKALAAYYHTVSNGRVELVYDVYPQATDSAYQLDSSMAHYGLQNPSFGLGEFVYDAMHQADQDTSLHLYDESSGADRYDAYVIFHAGSDQQNNLPGIGQETPGDLFTGYIKLGQSFTLDSGHVTIKDAVIMPETASQDGRVTALNAVMGHEFGHQLGLVDLYDTRTFNTCVGDFSLMDDNGFGVNIDFGSTVPVLVAGVMPIFPDAWSRAFLGFVDVVKVTSANNIKVLAAELDTNFNQVLMVPINSDEYFLVENRRTDIDGEEIPGLQLDDSTDVILWPRKAGVSSNKANNREYDYLIPGSGMLIWHVDELVARLDYDNNGVDNFDQNTLQWFNFPNDPVGVWDNHHLFVAVMEADGIVDFGREYFSGYGNQADMFDINGNSEFGPNTNPPSVANDNGYTGITIGDISAALLVMTCDISISGRLAGWPNQTFVNSLPLTVADLNGDNKDEILTASGPFLLAYNIDGSSYFRPFAGKEIIVARNVLYGFGYDFDTLAVMGRIDSTQHFLYSLAVGDINSDGFAEVVGATSGGELVCFTAASLNNDGEAIQLFRQPLDGTAATAPIILDYDQTVPGLEILVYNDQGEKLVFDKDGNRLLKEPRNPLLRVMTDSLHHFELPAPSTALSGSGTAHRMVGAVAADFDRDGQVETAEVYHDGVLKINYIDGPVTVNVGDSIYSELATGDIDDDGYPEVLFCGDNRIYAYNHNGTAVSNFPVTVDREIPAGPVTTCPALADINGDGKLEIFVATHNGAVAGFDLQGNRLSNFPISVGGSLDVPVVFAHSGSTNAIFALTAGGAINALTTAAPQKIDWNLLYGSPRNYGSYVKSLPSPKPIADAIGYLYNYPNPASSRTTIRFSVRESGDISIKFYNVAGDMVFDTKVAAAAGTDSEYPFDCTRLASGVYFCQLETQAGDRRHCTVAIVK